MICIVGAHCDALELFEFAEKVLYQMPPLVEAGGEDRSHQRTEQEVVVGDEVVVEQLRLGTW